MILAGKALAVLDGEPAVTARHVREAAPLVLRHRVLPNYNATGENIGAPEIIAHVLEQIGEPAYA